MFRNSEPNNDEQQTPPNNDEQQIPPNNDEHTKNTDRSSSSFFFDDIDEDHFLVRKHLQRCSLNIRRPWSGDALFENKAKTEDTPVLVVPQQPRLSSVLKKPILDPPSRKFTNSSSANHSQQSQSGSHNNAMTNEVSKVEQVCKTSEIYRQNMETIAESKLPENRSSISDRLDPDSVSKLESAFSNLKIEIVDSSQISNNETHENCVSNPDVTSGDFESDHDSLCSQVSTPDSLNEKKVVDILNVDAEINKLEITSFEMESKNYSSRGSPDFCENFSTKPQSNLLNKIISYDEALNIPQTDDDKERMSSGRRKERPTELKIRNSVRPASAKNANADQLMLSGAEDKKTAKSSPIVKPLTPKTNQSVLIQSSMVSPSFQDSDFLRRTQSFRTPKANRAGRTSIGGPDAFQQFQKLPVMFEHLSPKDQKVMAVLMARKEKEREEERIREEIKMVWEAEKLYRSRLTEEASRSKQLPETSTLSSSTFQLRPSSSKQKNQLDESLNKDQSKYTSKSTLNTSLLRGSLPCGHNSSQECIEECTSIYKSTLSLEKKQQEKRAKIQQEIERKKRVELRLEEQKRKTEEYLRELRERQEQEQERALAIKRDRNEQIKQKMSQQNESTRKKLEQIKEYKKLSEKELYSMQENIEATLSAAEMKARKRKEEEATRIRKDLQMKIEKSQQMQKMMEDELKDWQAQALFYRQQQDKHAEEVQATQLARKKEALLRSREAKEKSQRDKMQKILEKEKEWRTSLETNILNKEEKSKMLIQEKEALVQKSRAQAQLTRRLREELKLNQSLTDLDKLSKYVELQKRILN